MLGLCTNQLIVITNNGEHKYQIRKLSPLSNELAIISVQGRIR